MDISYNRSRVVSAPDRANAVRALRNRGSNAISLAVVMPAAFIRAHSAARSSGSRVLAPARIEAATAITAGASNAEPSSSPDLSRPKLPPSGSGVSLVNPDSRAATSLK